MASPYFDRFQERLMELVPESDKLFWAAMQEAFPPRELAQAVAQSERDGFPPEVLAEAMHKLIHQRVRN